MNNVTYPGDSVLDIMSSCAPNRNRSVEKLIRKYVFEKLPAGARVLEFGAGKGEFIFRFANTPGIELLAVEADQAYRKILSEKLQVYESLEEVPGELDCIYLIDVLEHIKDDSEMISRFYDKLKANGRLFIYVPARMELYSAFDKSIGHYRRYSNRRLNNIVSESGFYVRVNRYHDMLGYLASAVNKVFSRRGELNPTAVKIYDRFLLPVTNILETVIRTPIGKSIYLSAVKE